MTPEQKQRAAQLLAEWNANLDDAGRYMAALLQELVDAPEPEPVARVTGYYAGYLSIATVDGRVLPAGTALFTAPPARADILDNICDALKIGAEARTETVIIENIGNALRRSRCLDAVERDLFTSQIEDDESGELIDDCPLNWGDEPDEYVASVKELLRLSAPTPAEAPADVARDAELLRKLKHSIGQAKVSGNDWRRELDLMSSMIDTAVDRQGGES